MLLPEAPKFLQQPRSLWHQPRHSACLHNSSSGKMPAVLSLFRQVAASPGPWHQGSVALRAPGLKQALLRRSLQCSAAAADAAAASQAAPSSNGALSRIVDIELKAEAEQSYLAYAMSVIVGRALPDVQDGLKPVHRRILFAMNDLGLVPTKPYRKCARVVGEVLGKYHPHGDSAVYDALVRMAQNFSMRAPLVSGHGNFGSLDNDPPAAMRYTECRLQAVSSAVLLADLDYETVDFAPNFDGSQEEPRVLPARVPNLLVNGSSGIAVGIATRIPPHNLREVVRGLHALIDKPDISIPELMEHIPAPDFPTGGEILMSGSIREAYEHGKGPITLRGKAFIEGGEESEDDSSEASTSTATKKSASRKKATKDKAMKPSIVITELPYQTNKSAFVADVARLVEEQKLTGISDVRDESDREGMRVVVEVRRGSSPQVVLNNLYKSTALQMRFPVNAVALVDGTPQTLTLKEFLQKFLEFRCEVVRRRARFNLRKAQRRQHTVEGLLIAMQNLDKIVITIRAAKDGSAAAVKLQQDFGLSQEQSDAVLSMALRRLTSLEAGKLQEEADQLNTTIISLEGLLADGELVYKTVKQESQEIADKHGDERRTTIRAGESGALSEEDIVPNRPSVLVFSRKGYIKRMPADLFATQGKGGRGVTGARMRDNDTVEEVVHVMDHDTVLFFSPDGICRSLKAYQIPVSSKIAMGAPLTQVLNVSKGTGLAAILNIDAFEEGDYLVMLSKNGLIKRTPLKAFTSVRASGIAAMKLKPGDRLIWVDKCTESDSLLLANSEGKAIRFCADDSQVPATSRASMGVSSMVLREGVNLVGMCVLPATLPTPQGHVSESETEDEEENGEHYVNGSGPAAIPAVLFVTANGLGKRVNVDQFRLQKRGGVGLKGISLGDGDALAAIQTVGVQSGADEEEMLLSTAQGRILRTPVSTIRASSRSARGSLVSKLQEDDVVQAVTILQASEGI